MPPIKKGARLTAQVGPPEGGGLCRRVVFAFAQGEGNAIGAALRLGFRGFRRFKGFRRCGIALRAMII